MHIFLHNFFLCFLLTLLPLRHPLSAYTSTLFLFLILFYFFTFFLLVQDSRLPRRWRFKSTPSRSHFSFPSSFSFLRSSIFLSSSFLLPFPLRLFSLSSPAYSFSPSPTCAVVLRQKWTLQLLRQKKRGLHFPIGRDPNPDDFDVTTVNNVPARIIARSEYPRIQITVNDRNKSPSTYHTSTRTSVCIYVNY